VLEHPAPPADPVLHQLGLAAQVVRVKRVRAPYDRSDAGQPPSTRRPPPRLSRVQRWDDLDQVPRGYGPSVVTLGNFDGVHLGHRSVLGDVVAKARLRDARAVAVTFDPHPLQVLYPGSAPTPLTGLDHRLELMAATGLDATLVMTFTRELALWSPEEFVRRVFAEALSAVEVVVGRDVRFGHRNSGDLSTLRELGAAYGFTVTAMDDLGTSDSESGSRGDAVGGRRWSSTWARELIADGDVSGAARILGRAHRVDGVVVHGDHRGRELGYPTANLDAHPTGVVPADGVYAGWLVRVGRPDGDPERRLPAAVSIGTNPTFDGTQRRVEAYVLDRTDLDLYGERVGIELVARLRPTVKFGSVDALLVQMAEDVRRCHEVLAVG
jgi:riboflavin kinase / FMN adenylyltransferase